MARAGAVSQNEVDIVACRYGLFVSSSMAGTAYPTWQDSPYETSDSVSMFTKRSAWAHAAYMYAKLCIHLVHAVYVRARYAMRTM